MVTESEYFMNAGRGDLYASGDKENDQYKLLQQGYKADQNRRQNLAQIDQWEQSRNPYYSSLYESMNKAAEAPIQQSYADRLKQMQLQHVSRGTSGGSQNVYNQGQISAAQAMDIANARQRTQDYVQGIRRNDMSQAQNLRMQQYQLSPFEQQYYQSLLGNYGVGDRVYSAQAALDAQRLRDNAAYQQSQSQIYGQLIGSAANVGSAALMA